MNKEFEKSKEAIGDFGKNTMAILPTIGRMIVMLVMGIIYVILGIIRYIYSIKENNKSSRERKVFVSEESESSPRE